MNKAFILCIAGLFVWSGIVFSGGGPEGAVVSVKEISVPVTAPEGTDVSVIRKQMLLPAAACFAYTHFEQKKDALSFTLSQNMTTQIQKQEPLDKVEKTQVYLFSVELSLQTPEPAGFKKRVSVAFTLKDMTKQGSAVKQAVQFALQQGIKKSRMKSGQARIAEINYKGGGRFTALVELM